ncbi:hypothetical protein F8274_30745, partial [Micromonospora sp. AMSO31t]
MGEQDVPAETVHPGSAPDAADRPADAMEERPGQDDAPVAVARARVSVAGAAAPPPAEDRAGAPATATTYRAGGPAESVPPLDRRQPGASVAPPSTWSAFAAAERPGAEASDPGQPPPAKPSVPAQGQARASASVPGLTRASADEVAAAVAGTSGSAKVYRSGPVNPEPP